MPEAAGSWTTIELAGHPCDLFEPSKPNEHGFALLYLHGVHLGRLVDNAVVTGQLARFGLPALAPITRRSWWTDRVCPEFDATLTAEQHVLNNVVPYFEARWGSRPPRIGLWGTSMGGQGALRLAFKHPNRFPVVAAISPAIDFQQRWREDPMLQAMYRDPEAARQDTATLHVHPLNWPRNIWFCCDPADERWHEGAERLRMKLYSLGIPHLCDLDTSAGGHGWDYYNHMAPTALAFLVERLEQERRRVR